MSNATQTQLTEKETTVLNAMREGMDRANEGWVHELSIPIEGKALSGVVSSLVKKGCITTDEEKEPGMEACFAYEVDEAWQLDDDGLDAAEQAEQHADEVKHEEKHYQKAQLIQVPSVPEFSSSMHTAATAQHGQHVSRHGHGITTRTAAVQLKFQIANQQQVIVIDHDTALQLAKQILNAVL